MNRDDSQPARIPRASYRFQVHRDFGFDAVREQLPYLTALGISDIYLSPILQAAPGSMHGYDVIDPTSINTEFGGEPAFARMVEALRRLELGLIVDIVPNHMGIADGANPWWEDVLRLGRDSPFAPVFDIDWDVPGEKLNGRVLLPILGDHLEAVLARGELTLEARDGGAVARYYDRALPLAPGTLEASVGPREDLQRHNEQRTSPEGIAALRRLFTAQHYRLDFWRDGKPLINYRRFFEIDTLAGVRQEDPAVFDRTHELIVRLVREGAITGLRIDHIDGLADPAAYLERLQRATGGSREAPAIYVVVEKILGHGEQLPQAWATDGTTGYEFLNQLNGIFVAREHEDAILTTYRQFTGRAEEYSDIAYAARRAVVDGPLAGRFAIALERLRASAPEVLNGLEPAAFDDAVRAIVASLPVYRTYHTANALDPAAPHVLEVAVTAALAAEPRLERDALAAARALEAPPAGPTREVVMTLQQLTPAVAAKGLEDSAFYRFVPLASLNAVGGEPGRFGWSVSAFHEANALRARDWPAAMTATATHDHKRGADARARIDVLSELPGEWHAALDRWSELNGARARGIDPRDEHLVYQAVLGSWPPGAGAADIESTFVERIQSYMLKAIREGGEQSSWLDPDEGYEGALSAFVARILDAALGRPFLEDCARFALRLARAGAINSLAMVALRVAAPGVPDTYQGRERWDLSLVDPDNRRAVDYPVRRSLLEQMRGLEEDDPQALGSRAAVAALLLGRWETGEVKQYVLTRMLERRGALAPLFLEGAYLPLEARGAWAEHVVTFARQLGDRAAIVVAPRLTASLPGAATDGPLWAPKWGDTVIPLPDSFGDRRYRDAITGIEVEPSAGSAPPSLALANVLASFPVALLEPVR